MRQQIFHVSCAVLALCPSLYAQPLGEDFDLKSAAKEQINGAIVVTTGLAEDGSRFGTLPSDKAALKIANGSLGWVDFSMIEETQVEEVVEEVIPVISDELRTGILEFLDSGMIQSVIRNAANPVIVLDGVFYVVGESMLRPIGDGSLEPVVKGCDIALDSIASDYLMFTVYVEDRSEGMKLDLPDFFKAKVVVVDGEQDDDQ